MPDSPKRSSQPAQESNNLAPEAPRRDNPTEATRLQGWIQRVKDHWFVSLVLLVFVVVVGIGTFGDSLKKISDFVRSRNKVAIVETETAVETATAVGTETVRPEVIPVHHDQLVYLAQTPKQMMTSVEQMTALQANTFIENTYVGKWIRIAGPIKDVTGSSKNHWSRLIFYFDGIYVRVDLDKDQFNRAMPLQEGDIVTVDAVFQEMDALGPSFENGRLIGSESVLRLP